MKYITLLLLALLWIPSAFAQVAGVVEPDTQTVSVVLQGLLSALVLKYPWVSTLVAFVGTMRLWAKPAFSAIHSIVDVTATKWDDGLWAKGYMFFTANPVGKALAYVIDWTMSIKIQPPTKNVSDQQELPR